MNDKKGNKTLDEKRDLKKRLAEDVHVILSGCLHQFENEKELEEACFDVDAIVAGRLRPVHHRSRARVKPATKPYESSVSRGTFIPHANLFNNIVRAHYAQN